MKCCPVCGQEMPPVPITIIPERAMVVSNKGFVVVTGKEAGILEALAERYPNVATKEMLMDHLYSLFPDDEPEMKIIDVFICKVRKKVAPLGLNIETSWGRGYYIKADSQVRVVHEAAA